MAIAPLTAAQLRRELNLRAEAYAREHGLLYDVSSGPSASIVFGRDELGRHGNFHAVSYDRICAMPEWSRRLTKPHTTSRRSVARKDWRWMELDSACSSDALLMSIFCHPEVFDGRHLSAAVSTVLGVNSASFPNFGISPGVPLREPLKLRRKNAQPRERFDRTEIDLVLGDLFLEAKLTESNFQTAPLSLVTRYRDLQAVFYPERLPRSILEPPPLPPNLDPDDPTVNLPRRTASLRIVGYQLIRNILAASDTGASFCVLCDARRRDLIEVWFSVLSAVRSYSFTTRLRLLTWQDLAAALPNDLRHFLAVKYGIEPAF